MSGIAFVTKSGRKENMLRAFCSEWDGTREVPPLSRDELHHLVRVRRVRNGEAIEILNGRGDILSCTVDHVSGKHLELSIDNLTSVENEPVERHLLVAMPKGKTFIQANIKHVKMYLI